MESLTKENFWNEMSEKYPKAVTHFKMWVDRYKMENKWYKLFNEERIDAWDKRNTPPPKYHELPIAMQFGIFCEYIYQEHRIFSMDITHMGKAIAYHLKAAEERDIYRRSKS